MSYVRDFMSMAMYIELPIGVHRNGHRISASALADLVARTGVVDLRIALLVRDRVVEPDDAEPLVDAVHRDGVVGTADVGVGARAFDGQLVVVAADVEGLAVGAVEFGRRADGAVIDGVADLDLATLGAECCRRSSGISAVG